jgi:hypothetical protein
VRAGVGKAPLGLERDDRWVGRRGWNEQGKAGAGEPWDDSHEGQGANWLPAHTLLEFCALVAASSSMRMVRMTRAAPTTAWCWA